MHFLLQLIEDMSSTVCATWLISLVVYKLLNFVNLHNDITYMQWTPCLYIPLKDQFYITYVVDSLNWE